MGKKSTDKFEKTVLGAVSVLVENSNHNSDFDAPRMVDGVLTASDKSLKFYWRRFMENGLNKEVFYSKKLDLEGKVKTIKDRVKDLNIKSILDYFKCVDNKFFGFTILDVDKLKCDMNGCLQIEYANNIYSKNDYVKHTIIAQFSSGDDKAQTTIGSEHKVNKANYVHYLKFSPKKMSRDVIMTRKEMVNNVPYYMESEVEEMKYAFSHCIGSSVDGSYNSSSKSGTSIGLTIFITLKDDCNRNITIKNAIKCTNNHNEYDLTTLFDIVNDNKDYIESVDISYIKGTVSFTTNLPKDSIYNIYSYGYEI